MKQRYQKTKELWPIILEKQAQGMSHRAIEEELGLEGDRPIHNLLKHERGKEKQLPKQRGRNPLLRYKNTNMKTF